MRPSIITCAVLLALSSYSAHAQTAPNTGDALRQSQPPSLPAQPAAPLPQVRGEPIEPPLRELPSGPQIMVKSLEVIGNRVIKAQELQALVADAVGKAQTLADLEALAQRITQHYRAQGYFVARAYIPAQEVSAGVVKIRVVEGNYGKFVLKNESLVRSDIVQGMLDDVLPEDIVSLDTLERVMLLINDTPGVRVSRADVMPGDKVGTSDFAVDTVATPSRNGYVLIDNYGSVYTGLGRLSFNVDFNSPSDRGDRLSISGMGTDTSGLANGRLGYSALLRPNGLRGEVALARTEYALGDSYRSLDAKGTADTLDLTLTYPVRRTRAQTIETSLNLAYKDLVDKINSTNTTTPKQTTALTAGLRLRDEDKFLGLDGLTQANVALTAGNLAINDAAAKTTDIAGANTVGDWSKLTASISRATLLPKKFLFTASLRTQQSLNLKNLDGSERMAVSGSAGVMGYPSGELTGSNATHVRLELSRPLPNWGGLQSNWLVFANWGQAAAAKPVSVTENVRSVSDVGVAWTGNYSGLIFKAHLAHRLDNEPNSEPYAQNKFLVQLGYQF